MVVVVVDLPTLVVLYSNLLLLLLHHLIPHHISETLHVLSE